MAHCITQSNRRPVPSVARGRAPVRRHPVMAITMRLALAFLVIALAELAPALAVQGEEPWLIVPGVKVGAIAAKTSEAELIQIYGKANVQSKDIDVGEGFTKPGAVLYPNESTKTASITWKDQKHKRFPDTITISGEKKSHWRTAHSITIGTTLKELEKINGKPFFILGPGGDYSGTVWSWGKGDLEREFEQNGRTVLRLQPTLTQATEKEYESLIHEERPSGQKGIRSDHKVLQKINPWVYEIVVQFK